MRKPTDTRLLRLLAVNAIGGAVAAAVFLAGLLMTDAASLGHLISNAEYPILVALALYASLVVTFSSAAMGAAVMMMNRDGD